LTRQEAGSLGWTHLYTVGGERLWTIHEPGGLNPLQETVSLRDLSGRVLRQYEVSSGLGNDEWSWKRDIIYGDGRLISSVHPGGEVRHYHLDHLGTPRRVTDSAGNLLYQHDYLPYGEEITDSSQSSFPFKFTGHERDSGYAGTMDDLDYMHARYYSPFLGRFGRVDPFRGSPTSPQSLNRYAYALLNPTNLIDPKGLQAGDMPILEGGNWPDSRLWTELGWSYFGMFMSVIGPGPLPFSIAFYGYDSWYHYKYVYDPGTESTPASLVEIETIIEFEVVDTFEDEITVWGNKDTGTERGGERPPHSPDDPGLPPRSEDSLSGVVCGKWSCYEVSLEGPKDWVDQEMGRIIEEVSLLWGLNDLLEGGCIVHPGACALGQLNIWGGGGGGGVYWQVFYLY
jgi:RHS repeat-associated protein